MVIVLAIYAIVFVILAVVLYRRYDTGVALALILVWSILILLLNGVIALTRMPQDEVLTTVPKNADIPQHFVVDAKEKVLYEEHENGELEFYAGEGRISNVDFVESTRVKTPIVKIKAKRIYAMDNINPFKSTSTINAFVDRVVIPVDYSEKVAAITEASK